MNINPKHNFVDKEGLIKFCEQRPLLAKLIELDFVLLTGYGLFEWVFFIDGTEYYFTYDYIYDKVQSWFIKIPLNDEDTIDHPMVGNKFVSFEYVLLNINNNIKKDILYNLDIFS